jgi:hypothetical protein
MKDTTEQQIATLEQRKKEILANEQDWMREDRAAQVDKEIAALSSVVAAVPAANAGDTPAATATTTSPAAE